MNRANLSKAEQYRVVFTKAKLGGVNFKNSNLARAKLSGLALDGVQMAGAYLYLTHLHGSDLSRAVGIKPDQLELACGDPDTKLPPGMAAPRSWPCPTDDE